MGLWVWLILCTLQDYQPIKSTRRHVTFSDPISSSDNTDQSDDEELLVKKRTTKTLTIASSSSGSSSDNDEKPYDSSEQLSARTKHTAHTVKSADEHHSDSSESASNSSPSQFLDCEAEEVWHSDEGSGSDDMQDFIDDAVEEWGSCDASEVDNNSMDVAQSISPKRCHGRKLLDSSSDEEVNGTSVAYVVY